jgi:hypothetical protein
MRTKKELQQDLIHVRVALETSWDYFQTTPRGETELTFEKLHGAVKVLAAIIQDIVEKLPDSSPLSRAEKEKANHAWFAAQRAKP